MTIEIALLLSFISVSFSVYSGISSLKRNKMKDDKKDASEMTTIIVKLEGIGKDTGEIRDDVKSMKEDMKNHSEQIIRLDESLKSAWKIISKLQDKINGEE